MSMFSLEVIWYLVIGICVIMYTVLDGFDLGVGSLHLFAKKDDERRIFLNAIGPVWDGNEVWLVVIVGALFAGFPSAYATLLSGFYVLNMILIACLIFRAVAIEFRSKQTSFAWRQTWDVVFSIASVLIGFCIGVIFGNLIVGVPIDINGDFVTSFSSFFTPYTVLIGITVVALFMMHGSIFLVMKTEGKLHDNLRKWVVRCVVFFVFCYVAMTIATLLSQQHMVQRMKEAPYYLLIPFCAMLVIANVPREIYKGRDGFAFISSCFAIALLVIVYGLGTFPALVRSNVSEECSLMITEAASSPLTLKILLVIVCIGVPLVLAYGYYIYRIFRGKVKIGPMSY